MFVIWWIGWCELWWKQTYWKFKSLFVITQQLGIFYSCWSSARPSLTSHLSFFLTSRSQWHIQVFIGVEVRTRGIPSLHYQVLETVSDNPALRGQVLFIEVIWDGFRSRAVEVWDSHCCQRCFSVSASSKSARPSPVSKFLSVLARHLNSFSRFWQGFFFSQI